MSARPTATMQHRIRLSALLASAVLGVALAARAQTTTFTYQGQLTDAGSPANGNYDLQFALFDAATAGTPIGSQLTRPSVAVSGGVFTVQLDFGVNAFPGADRFLQVGVQPAGGSSFTTLAPRQQISSTPYAIRTLSAATADALSTTCTACVQDAQIKAVTGSKVTGTIPVASVPAGSGNYVQNTTTQQAGANFNIGGSGTAASMNVNGPLSFGGSAPPATAPAGQGRMYFDSASHKVKVSENGSAFVNLVGASGVSGSGTANAIPLWSSSTALTNSVVTQTGNNVGVGTAAPLHRLGVSGGPPWTGDSWGGALDLENASAIGWRGNSSGFRFGIGHTNAGLAFFRTGNELGTTGAAPSYDFLINNAGKLGIGSPSLVPSLTSKVEVFAQDGLGINGFQPFLTLRDTNAGSKSSFMQGVNGDVVLLTNSRAAMVLKDGTGNVLIGGAPSQHRLNVSGGPTWTSNGWAGALSLDNASAIGWRGNAGGQRFGIGQTVGGLYFFRTFSDPGSTGFAANYDVQITDTGNLTQARDKSGLVKAMMLVNPNGTIPLCYNSFLPDGGASTPGCGFSVTPLDPATNNRPYYVVNLGFFVSDRFISITPINAGGNIGYSVDTVTGNSFNVRLWYSDQARDQGTFAPFYAIVF